MEENSKGVGGGGGGGRDGLVDLVGVNAKGLGVETALIFVLNRATVISSSTLDRV